LDIGTLNISGTADGSLNIEANNEVSIDAGQVDITGDVSIDGDLSITNAASGCFLTIGNLVVVKNGIIVSII
jgi:hypothetical protein